MRSGPTGRVKNRRPGPGPEAAAHHVLIASHTLSSHVPLSPTNRARGWTDGMILFLQRSKSNLRGQKSRQRLRPGDSGPGSGKEEALSAGRGRAVSCHALCSASGSRLLEHGHGRSCASLLCALAARCVLFPEKRGRVVRLKAGPFDPLRKQKRTENHRRPGKSAT